MTRTTHEAFAVMRKMDDRARAIFATYKDANAYADHLNQTVPFGLAFGSGGHIWTVYPWTIPTDTFDVEQ